MNSPTTSQPSYNPKHRITVPPALVINAWVGPNTEYLLRCYGTVVKQQIDDFKQLLNGRSYNYLLGCR
jgi:hypothetical protein